MQHPTVLTQILGGNHAAEEEGEGVDRGSGAMIIVVPCLYSIPDSYSNCALHRSLGVMDAFTQLPAATAQVVNASTTLLPMAAAVSPEPYLDTSEILAICICSNLFGVGIVIAVRCPPTHLC